MDRVSSRNALGVSIVKHQSTTTLPSLTLAVLASLTLAVLASLTRLIAHHATLAKLLVAHHATLAKLLVAKLLVATVPVLLVAKLLVAKLLVATVPVLLVAITTTTVASISAIHLRLGKWAGP